MSRSFDVQINAKRIKFVKSCINVIIITLFYTKLYTWFGKNERMQYLNGAKISSIGGLAPAAPPPSKYAHGLKQSTTGHSFGTDIINVQKHAQDTSVLSFLLH